MPQQPNKNKKKVNGSTIDGTEEVRESQQDMKSKKAFKEYIKTDENRKTAEQYGGQTIDPKTGKSTPNKFEKGIRRGKFKGQETVEYDGSGKVIARAKYGTPEEEKLLKDHERRKKTTETSRAKTAEVNNYETQGSKQNKVYKKRVMGQKDKDKRLEAEKLRKAGVKKEDLPQ